MKHLKTIQVHEKPSGAYAVKAKWFLIPSVLIIIVIAIGRATSKFSYDAFLSSRSLSKANNQVREKAEAVSMDQLASAYFDANTSDVVDWRGKALTIKDRHQLETMISSLRFAEFLTDTSAFSVSNEVDDLVLNDSDGNELARFGMCVASAPNKYGKAWDIFMQELKQDQANQLNGVLSGLSPVELESIAVSKAFTYQLTPPVSEGESTQVKKETHLTDAADRGRLLSLLQSRNPELYSYDTSDSVALRMKLKFHNSVKSVVVVLPVKRLRTGSNSVIYNLDTSVAKDQSGQHLLHSLSSILQ